MEDAETAEIVAAGAVVARKGPQVLLIHRPKYDDWSFPKGKLDPGEHAVTAAVREVAEETGLHVRLGPPLTGQRYAVSGGRTKAVSYWVGRAIGSDDVSGYRANAEIDRVEWVPYEEALDRLSYEHDQETLREARPLRRQTRALVVLRHGDARSRKAWRRPDDRLRPLLQAGRQQAQRVIPVLAAYDVTRIVSSSSTRCVETVAPYADTSGWKLELEDGLCEESASAEGIVGIVDDLLTAEEGSVLCSHRPVLPAIFDVLGVRDPKLETGGLLVAHVRKGQVVATEVHQIH